MILSKYVRYLNFFSAGVCSMGALSMGLESNYAYCALDILMAALNIALGVLRP
jgi:hypothetical protein